MFFLWGSLFVFFDCWCLLFVFVFLSSFLGGFWGGSFILPFGGLFYSLGLISLVILSIILLREGSSVLCFLSCFLVFLRVLFFFSGNIFLLYIYFELSVFPIILIILGFGSQIEKINSSFYLFFYSSFCSFPFLVVLFNLGLLDLRVFFSFYLCWEFCLVVLLLFLIKFPLYFFHLWLPKAHVEAPTRASMLLAGLLLKLGTGGFLRALFLLKLNFEYLLLFVSLLGVCVRCFICLFQRDLKSLAAYSSVNHIIFLLFLLLNLRVFSVWRSLCVMVAHGFVSTLIFYFVGEFYHSSGTRIIYFFGGFLKVRVYFLVVFSLVWLFNGGVPPSLSFFSEFVGLSVLFSLRRFFFVGGLVYFFVSFYYTLYVLLSCFLGQIFLEVLLWNLFLGVFVLFWSVNLVFFSFIS